MPGHAGHAGMDAPAPMSAPMSMGNSMGGAAPRPPVPVMAALSFLALAAGVAIAFRLGPA